MTYAKSRYATLALAASCLCLPLATPAATTLLAQQPPPAAPSGVVSPDQNLPPHIRKLTGFGERAEFSLDGRRVLFLTKTFGDAMEIDLATGVIRNLTAHFPHYGFTRALYLANGHILLSGPTEFNPSNVGAARTNCWMFVMDPESRARPWPLGVKAAEGPVPSRKRMHIAWSYRAAQFPDKMPAGSSQMHEADIVYENGVPKLANQRQILDSRDLPFKATMEPQNYRPPHERELIFSAYDYQQGEVFGVDLTTGKLTNYSNGPGVYDEPEGIFPSGEFTTVESDKHNPAGQGFDRADIHKLKLDGSGAMERLTFFADVPTYRSSNPVVSDDGHYMAFQMGRSGVAAGIGYGIFLYDFTKAPATPAQAPAAPVVAQASSANGEGWVGRSAELALACVHKEYPNKIAHVLNDATDVKAPHDLTPAFFGCYDWHSSVHGHWLLARVARLHPQAPFAGRARAALDKSLTAEHIAGEVRYLKGAGRVSFERPYGLAWLLQLHGELREWATEQPADRDVRRWAETLEPLTQAAVARVADWLPKLTAPIRIGEHSQTAFSFGLMLDWTRATGEKKLETLLVSRARDFYAKDRACPMAYEPSGEDFLSPCVAEADLMRRVLPQAEFASWLREFLPPIPADGRGDWLAPGVVTDPSDPKLGHLYGLNLSRAWMLRAIAGSLPPSDPRSAALTAAARIHHTAGMTGVTGEHYEGSHWLGTFAVYLETSRGLPVHATRQ